MSASNKKKLRKQEAESQMTQRQQAASKEAKKQMTTTLTFCIIMVLVVCITAGALLTNPVKNIVCRNTDAVQVGDYTVSAVELNYFYVDAISKFYSQYQSYISYMLNVSTPLNKQIYDATTNQTWADYFLTVAHNNIQATYAVYDLAVSEGYTLDEEGKSALESAMMYSSLYAQLYGFGNVNKYLANSYGNGATEESYRAYYEKCLIAEAYYADYAEALEYNADQLSAYHAEHTGEFSSYNYAYVLLSVKDFYPDDAGTKGSDGKVTYTKEETDAAIKAAKEAADKLAAGEYADLDAFDAAIDQLYKELDGEGELTVPDKTDETEKSGETDNTEDNKTEEDKTEGEESEGEKEEEEEPKYDHESTKMEDVLYSKLNALFKDWMIGKVDSEDEAEDDKKDEEEEPTFETRNEGDMKVFENATGEGDKKTVNGFYVVRYQSENDNRFVMKNVRHILVSFKHLKADGTVDSSNTSSTYTDAEKEAAKKEADQLLADWLAGEATEESFSKLATEKTGDTASKESGGLYENVYPGQMVEAFEDWCYDAERKTGDYGIVETTYGYHIMYFVGETEQTYLDYMLTETMRSEDTKAWYDDLVEKMTITKITDKYVNKETTIR